MRWSYPPSSCTRQKRGSSSFRRELAVHRPLDFVVQRSLPAFRLVQPFKAELFVYEGVDARSLRSSPSNGSDQQLRVRARHRLRSHSIAVCANRTDCALVASTVDTSLRHSRLTQKPRNKQRLAVRLRSLLKPFLVLEVTRTRSLLRSGRSSVP